MGKVLLAHLPPEELNAYFAAASLRGFTTRTITQPEALRRVLDEVRQRGWAFSDQESEVGIRTVAAPLFNHSNQIDAALNVSAHAARVSMRELKRRCLPVLLDGARRISRALGASVPEGRALPRLAPASRSGTLTRRRDHTALWR
jgi:IclR family pca regulon transcriptional regulator